MFQKLLSGLRQLRTISSSTAEYLRLALAGKLMRIPMRLITSENAFSLAPQGWHYLRDLVTEYEQNPHCELEETTYYRFFQHERVRSVQYFDDLLFLHDSHRQSRNGRFKFYFGTYPWGNWIRGSWVKGYSVNGGRPWGYYYDRIEGKKTRDLFGFRMNPWYRPGDKHPLEQEWNHVIKLYQSLRQGYRPLLHNASYLLPCATLLVRRDGQMRAVRTEGHRRLSVLSHLGHEQVTVRITGVISEAEVDQWYYVKSGHCTREEALEIFNAYFTLNGRERIEYLSLPTSY